MATAKKVKVAVIGAGRTGGTLIKEMLKFPYIKIVGVADLNTAAEGVVFAKKKKIYTSADPMALVTKFSDIDILIEVSGDVNLKKKIKSHFKKTENTTTIIMHDLMARLFISVCTRSKSLIQSFHPKDVGIGA